MPFFLNSIFMMELVPPINRYHNGWMCSQVNLAPKISYLLIFSPSFKGPLTFNPKSEICNPQSNVSEFSLQNPT